MARVDDFKNAFKMAAAELDSRKPEEVADLSGARWDPDQMAYFIDFIDKPHQISTKDVRVCYPDSDQETPLTEQVLILHYLNAAKGVPETGQVVTYRELPAGEFYYSAFQKRAEIPMLKTFGSDPDRLIETAPAIGGVKLDGAADAVVRFQPCPRWPSL